MPRLFRTVRVRVLRDLDAEAAEDFLVAELGRRLVEVVARCRVRYEGRAESTLAEGDRVILFKPDGTLLVHSARGLKPVNWQPSGAVFHARRENGVLVVTSSRSAPKETVRMELVELHAVMSVELEDGAALALSGSEADLHAVLHARPDLVEPGFSVDGAERDTGRGPMDIVGTDERGRRVVVEVKRRAASVADVEQLRRYVERERAARAGVVRGVLLAPQVSGKARRYLDELGLECREVDWARAREAATTVRAAGQKSLAGWEA